MAVQSPYYMGFAGTITLRAETIIKVHLEAVQSLIEHGFKRFIIMSSHVGNDAIVEFIVDQINQTTSGIAVNYDKAVEPLLEPIQSYGGHAGTGEISKSSRFNAENRNRTDCSRTRVGIWYYSYKRRATWATNPERRLTKQDEV